MDLVYIADVTDSLDAETPLVPSCSMAGFSLHRVRMGKDFVLVKMFGNIVQGSLTRSEGETIAKEFLKALDFWKRNFYTSHFARIIGYSEYVDSILPSPVYQQTIMAKEHVKDTKDIPFLPFVQHIVEGVQVLHEGNVAHGDIRADNIFVGNDGIPCLADFGLSRIICLLGKHGNWGKTDVTPAMRWIPPEFIPHIEDDKPYDPTKEGDIWSLGMTIFELWSGKVPYLGTSLGGVPKRIRRGIVPKFPDTLRPDLENLRKIVLFICALCWKIDPAERKTTEELLYVIRESINGKSASSIKEEMDARRNHRAFPTGSNFPCHPPRGGSITSTDTTSTSGSNSIHAGSVSSPREGSDSGYDTTPESGPSRNNGVKLENAQDGFVPTGSHHNGSKGKHTNKSGTSQPAHGTQTSPNASPEERPGSTSLSPFSAFPPPPQPNLALASVNSWMTALLNYKAKQKLTTLNVERSSVGHDHQPLFTAIVTIDGKEYARCTDFKKKGADEKAAQETLVKLYEENPHVATEATPNYLSSFNSYLATHGLKERIRMEYEIMGEDHSPSWTCTLYRDGSRLSHGTAASKNKATEEAARKAAEHWNDW